MKSRNIMKVLAALVLGATPALATMPVGGAHAGWWVARQAGWGEGAEWAAAGAAGYLGAEGGAWAGGTLGAQVGSIVGPVGSVVGGAVGCGVGAL